MCTTAKYSLIAVILAVVIAVILWYRNWTIDRLVAVVVIGLGTLQLLSYACHSSLNSSTTGALVAFIIWFLLLAFSFTIYVYTRSKLAMGLTLISILFLIYVIYGIFSGSHRYLAYTYPGRSIPTWASLNAAGEESGIMGSLLWPYLGLFLVGWLCMAGYQGWTDITMYVLLAFIIITVLCVPVSFHGHQFGSYWTYLLIGLGLITLLIGSFCPPTISPPAKLG